MQNYNIAVDRIIPFRKKITNHGLSQIKQGVGNVLYSEKMYNMALRFYSEAVGLHPDSMGFLVKANCHMQLQEYKEALQDAEKSVNLDPKNFQGHLLLTTCALALGDLELARKYFLLLAELKPSDDTDALELKKIELIYTLYKEADKEFRKGNHSVVVKHMDKILVRLPSRKVKLRRAESLAFLRQYATAKEVASNILILNNNDEDAHYVLGLCNYLQGSLDLAIRRFRRIINISPTHEKTKELLAKATEVKNKIEEGFKACKDGCYQRSYQLYTEALEIDPNNKVTNIQLYIKRAKVLFKVRNIKDAIEDCCLALQLNNKYIDALLLRAKLNMAIKNYALAITDYESVCRISSCKEYKILLKHAREAMKRASKEMRLYSILGISPDSSPYEIKYAYRKKSLLHHPDKHVSAGPEMRKEQEMLFKEIVYAYNILIDPKKRELYDRGLKEY